MNTNDDLYLKNCFTEVEEGKINSKFNKTTMKCFDSEDNKFSMDCEGNLEVNSIISRETSPTTGLTIDQIYPVGSIYISTIETSPSNLFGGTWEQIKSRFLLASGENETNTTNYWGVFNAGDCNFPIGEMGGEPLHTLSNNEMPPHSHEIEGELKYSPSSSWWIGGSGGTTIEVDNVKTSQEGNGMGHNNMPPYLVVNMWKRIA